MFRGGGGRDSSSNSSATATATTITTSYYYDYYDYSPLDIPNTDAALTSAPSVTSLYKLRVGACLKVVVVVVGAVVAVGVAV